MKATIDKAGRLVLPKAVRDSLNLQGGSELEVRVVDDHIELTPASIDVQLVRRDGFLVAVPLTKPDRKLTVEEVERIRRETRESHL